MQASAVSWSLVIAWVDTKTSSMIPWRYCDWVVAPMRRGANTSRRSSPPYTWPNCWPLMKRKTNVPSYMPATCVHVFALMGACEMTVVPSVRTTDIWILPLWMPSENDVLLFSRLRTIGWSPETVVGCTHAATATRLLTVNCGSSGTCTRSL